MFRKAVSEKDLIIFIFASLVLYTLLFSRDFGQIYTVMSLTWLALLLFDKYGTRFPVERSNKNRLESVLIALVFTGIMLMVSAVITTLFYPTALPQGGGVFAQMKGVLDLIATGMVQASGPILAQSKILMLFGWTVLIGTTETHLICARGFEYIYDKLNKQGLVKNKITFNLIVLFIVIGAFSAILHLTAKGLDPAALMVTAIFFTLSTALVFWKKQSREAIMAHWLTNGLAVASIFSWI